MKAVLTGFVLLGLVLPAVAQDRAGKDAKDKADKTEPLPLPKEAAPAEPPAGDESGPRAARPPLELVIVPGEATATPYRKGVSFANGGVIAVHQPNPTTIVVTMSGLAATNADLVCPSAAGYHFTLEQCFQVCFNSRRVKGAHLALEGRVIGLLRTNHELYTCCLWKKGGTASTDPAVATVGCGGVPMVGVELPARSICCTDDMSVYNHDGPYCVPVQPGKYELHGTWGFGTTHPPFCCRGASAEFAPEPQYCQDNASWWFQHFHPFNGHATKDFGFQVTIRLIPD